MLNINGTVLSSSGEEKCVQSIQHEQHALYSSLA